MGNRPYVLNLLAALSATDSENEYVVYVNRRSRALLPHLGRNFSIRLVPGPSGILGRLLQEQLVLPWLVRRDRLDILHCPVQTMPMIVSMFRTRVVITVLDLRYLVDRRNFKWYHLVYRKLAYYPSAILAHHIITISDFTRATVMERWNLPKQRITAVLLGVGGDFRPASPAAVEEAQILKAHGVHGRFVLSSANSPHKNPDLVVRAFARLAPDLGADWTLVLLGTRPDLPYVGSLVALVSELGLEGRVIFTGHVPDVHVPVFYRSAKVYVTLSDYEGFGLTVLEAMASGVPVVASNATALQEVVGDAGILVEARAISAVALAIKSAATDAGVREGLVRQGLARAREFSWSLTARRTREVYERVSVGLRLEESLRGDRLQRG